MAIPGFGVLPFGSGPFGGTNVGGRMKPRRPAGPQAKAGVTTGPTMRKGPDSGG